MAAMYAVYHGSAGLQRIAQKVHKFTQVFKSAVEAMGYKSIHDSFFDTVTLDVAGVSSAEAVHGHASHAFVNLRRIDDRHVGVTFDESVSANDLVKLLGVFSSAASAATLSSADLAEPTTSSIQANLRRTSEFLPHPVFNKHHSETEMLRYITHLASKDLGLVHSMIPLGSCTMKLNSTSSMIPLTWPEFSTVHPFAPPDQVKGYHQIIRVYSLLF
jgi:glycine dehydrogenase